MKNTPIIAISNTQNWWKTTLLENREKRPWIKTYPETARPVYEALLKVYKDKYKLNTSAQDAIRDIEIQRLDNIKEDARSWLYDLILIDRTATENQVFMQHLANKWLCEDLWPLDESVIDCCKMLYDMIIYFRTPIHKSFDNYVYDETIFQIDHINHIQDNYKWIIKYFNNYKVNEAKVDKLIFNILTWDNIV